MQTLGLSDSTPRTESRLKSLFWPTIQNDGDLDYLTEQGFWICFLVGLFNLVFSFIAGVGLFGCLESAFYFLAGAAVRMRSRAAAMLAFAAYLLGAIVLQKYTGQGFGILRLVFLALLLANIRGMWLSAAWPKSESDTPPVRLNETLFDKLSDQMPSVIWPRLRIAFYLLAAIEFAILLLELFPIGSLGMGPSA
jgi:hypothetical protein